ncbi:MAG: hypothetical protein DWQ31_01360 [Planctomycetota bacterium]|nr:MAG: hypothetical protein DWQ31_01360 [Planctomycetota bacterium]REJ95902.1 MAG: hypothetical protein DWQ35_05515 [Planctomycetota bacterium]REK25290.1 MAG: hypothetical protein DWQ42_11860 [Planctomycetota bacterium]REK37980.1 MAG: hypothetical protein DWQ46_21235 [Planctomycetota bacterium]
MKARMLLVIVSWCALASTAAAQDVQYEERDGVTYRVTRSRVQRPMSETQIVERNQTVYREHLVTETRPSVRTVYTPVTEYQMEARWHGLLNPFVRPYVGYHYVPHTRWEAQVQEVPQTVTRRELLPETRTVQVPVRSYRMVEDEVIRRTAVGPSGSRTASVLSGSRIGGTQLSNDPPRTATGDWQPANEETYSR